ncbi:MAG: hypothetical protein RQ869_03020 [Candidatus Nanopusillus sp.]|jgi:hypothetical protein|nr:hypothetical protein [Candidatus Nanopusillus sp.]
MKIKLNKKLLEKNLPSLLRNFLIEKYNSIKNKDKPSKLEIKFLAYRALAYFQYLNSLYPSLAIQKFKDYVLSDGKDNKVKIKLSYKDGSQNKVTYLEMEIPLRFDDLLSEVCNYLMNYKLIINTISDRGYITYLRRRLKINASDITAYSLIERLMEIRLDLLVILKKHWITINKEILPYLIEKTQITKTKNNLYKK